MSTTTSFILVILLLAVNGFFVAAEFALVKARGFRIESLAGSGSSAAAMTLRIQHNLEAYLAACQLGITMASLGLGWVGEPAVAALLEPLFHLLGMSEPNIHTMAFLVGFLSFSALHIVVGEQVPKTFAIRKAEPVSLWVSYPLHVSYLLAWPLNWLLNRATSAILGVLGVAEASHAEVLSREEIKDLVSTSREHGEIHHKQADMLNNLFDFDQRLVGRVMIPKGATHCLDMEEPAGDNLRIIRETEHSRFPLIDGANDDALVGMVLVKDIHAALLRGEEAPWSDLARFCREALIVPESQRVSKLFELMRIRRAHMACVVDEYGAFIGIVTLEDLLEEIVGEIQDETDDDQQNIAIIPLDENRWEIDGLVSLTDLTRTIGLITEDSLDANTLSGLCMQRLGRMPEPGDELQEENFRLRIISLEEHRVGKVHALRITGSVPGSLEPARETEGAEPPEAKEPLNKS